MKLVNYMLDKKLKVRCRAKKVMNVRLACFINKRAKTKRNPNGLIWKGPFKVKFEAKQRYCCAQSAKKCGQVWSRFWGSSAARKYYHKGVWATPKGLSNIGESLLAGF